MKKPEGEGMTYPTDRPVAYWDCCDDAEILYHDEKFEAIEAYLDGGDRWDGTITVHGFARMVVPEPIDGDANELINSHFEGSWEEYLSPVDSPITTERMLAAARIFLRVMHEDFEPWVCEIVTSEEVDVAAWIAEHRPKWLEKKP